ncbi:MAG: GAF domain-containing protein [Candidatus Dojkabacteria bacterium]|nr:GAF domain-containing protein [Candidatus Dojkabacteria bacterium]MDQ7020499.1 GAF domain-containing protein [Candidatus Dojkabacteria bacterium]
MFRLLKKQKKTESSNIPNLSYIGDKDILAITKLLENVASDIDLNTILQTAIDSVVKLLEMHGGILFLLEEDGKYVYTKSMAKSSYSDRALKLLRANNLMDKLKVEMSQKDNFVVDSIVTGNTHISDKLSDFTIGVLNRTLVGIIQKTTQTGAAIVVPIRYKAKITGALMLTRKRSNLDFTKEESIKNIYATAIGISIENARLFEERKKQINNLTKQNKELTALYTQALEISKSLEPERVAELAVNSVPQDEYIIGSIISTLTTDGSQLQIQAITENKLAAAARKLIGDYYSEKFNIKVNSEDFANSPSLQAFRQSKIIVTDDLENYLSPPVPKKLVKPLAKIIGAKTVVIIPLSIRQMTFGTVAFLLRDKNKEDSKKDTEKTLVNSENAQADLQAKLNAMNQDNKE